MAENKAGMNFIIIAPIITFLLLMIFTLSWNLTVIQSGFELLKQKIHLFFQYEEYFQFMANPASSSYSSTDRILSNKSLEYNFISGTNFIIPSVAVRVGNVGLGNQLFKYAHAYALAQRLNAHLYIQTDIANVNIENNQNFNIQNREYALQYFNISSHVSYLPRGIEFPSENSFQFRELQLRLSGNIALPNNKIIILSGSWESETYFQDHRSEIIQQFHLQKPVAESYVSENKEIMEKIESSESVSVHVRRGDFLSQDKPFAYRVLALSYQIKAMEMMTHILKHKNLTFFIFSDDIDYVREEFRHLSNNFSSIVFVSSSNDTRSSLREFYIMSKCKHNIIPNSTFSWWAAYLNNNEDKIVIAPFPHQRHRFYELFRNINGRKYIEWLNWNHAYPKEWLTINPFQSFDDSV